MSERSKFGAVLVVFVVAWVAPIELLPESGTRLILSLVEALSMLHEYSREHVLLCLVPAFFIAGAISVFVSQAAVMKYLGATASKYVAYPVAAVSGTILAVCSCTVLPLFSGIHKRGAGLGPAIAFLYSGPAINVLAIILTARVLGVELGAVRAAAAIIFSVVIGLVMHVLYRREEQERVANALVMPSDETTSRKLWQDSLYFAAMIAILVFANWGEPPEGETGIWAWMFDAKWIVTGIFLAALGLMLWRWFSRGELQEWGGSAWTFALQIMPLLFAGVLAAGFLLGRPGQEAMIPSAWVEGAVGGNSLWSNFFAAIAGAFMYVATLTEVPILEGLMGAGMGKGPALSLLLAGPAVSLPSLLVIRGVLGAKKTVVYVSLVVAMSTFAGLAYGTMF